jgi:hypothetical protein
MQPQGEIEDNWPDPSRWAHILEFLLERVRKVCAGNVDGAKRLIYD